jgi:hypothetical protein
MANQNASLAWRHVRRYRTQFVDDPLERPWARRRIAPGEPSAIVRTDMSEIGKRRLHESPAER